MTSGFKTTSNYYLELMTNFPPRPISNEEELIATQKRINSILDKGQLNQDEKDYLRVLGMLVYEYEEKYEPIPKLEGVELLKAMIEEDNLQPKDFGRVSRVRNILEGKREITEEEKANLVCLIK
ncbi:putative transcription regulator with HTH domain [Gloeothece citriformis PCC 7424]|uniref:Putative transcription regulator with HTH domain n=2 Tax=Gloeothece TaxID=28070 RepID=B7KIF0_GLOC7|nr:putative transcription regulator with HTH domain [Gloeothece citriformis PCC 7424]